jgi:hypothetical protein
LNCASLNEPSIDLNGGHPSCTLLITRTLPEPCWLWLDWDMVFRAIRKIHAPAEAGVFFCGPKPLGSVLHVKCNMYSEPGFHFVWGKENF